MPEGMIEGLRGRRGGRNWKRWRRRLAYDSALMGDGDVGLVPVGAGHPRAGPALVLCGDEGLVWKIDVNRRLAGALPNARLRVLRGDGHVVDPAKLAPVVAEFLDMATGPMSAPVDR